jgi:hypothetical protein
MRWPISGGCAGPPNAPSLTDTEWLAIVRIDRRPVVRRRVGQKIVAPRENEQAPLGHITDVAFLPVGPAKRGAGRFRDGGAEMASTIILRAKADATLADAPRYWDILRVWKHYGDAIEARDWIAIPRA